MKKPSKIFKRILIWRMRYVSNRQLLYFLSVLVGLTTGLAAVVLKNAVHFIRYLVEIGIGDNQVKYLYIFLPLLGILLVVLIVKIFFKEPMGHGIPNILYSISKKQGFMKKHAMYSSIITSSLTVGFGGSVGLESPSVSTGAAIGSNIATALHLDYKDVKLLIGAGCVGAIAAIFNAPIAAIVFAIEVIMLDLTMASLVPLLLASVTAALTSYLIMGMNVVYPFDVTVPFNLSQVPYIIALGIISGLMSLFFAKTYFYFERIFSKYKSRYKRWLFGGLLLGGLIFLFPPLYGEGYEVINSILAEDTSFLFDKSIFMSMSHNDYVVIFILLSIILTKVVAMSLTFGAGGVGGIFAPSLFIGANLGFLFGFVVNHFELSVLPQANFALLGMGALISGVLHAPLTGIFLIGDITGGYALILPLMLVSTISYATVRTFSQYSVYTHQLAKRNELLTHHKDKTALALMSIKPLIETNFSTVSPNTTLRTLVKVVSESRRNIYPVVNDQGEFCGIVILDNIRKIMFKPELYDKVKVMELLFMPEYIVSLDEHMEDVAEKFRESGNYNLVVVDKGVYLGFISRANVFSTYRKYVRHFSED